MSQHFGQYNTTVFVALFSGFLTVLFVNSLIVFGFGYADYERLLKYQTDKIERSEGYDTVFVGDSSLGNAISVEAFDEVTGLRSVNLALTGQYGYAGSLNMARRAMSRNPIRNLIVFHTLDMMTRPISYDGYMFTAASDFRLPEGKEIDHLKAAANRLLSPFELYRLVRIISAIDKVQGIAPMSDYLHQLPQAEKIRQRWAGKLAREDFSPLNVRDIVKEKATFLQKIKQFCESSELVCIYVHGPLLRARIEASRDYLNKVNVIIRRAGFKNIVSEPLGMALAQMGDSSDHVRPEYKADYTRKYATHLLPYLKRSEARP